MPSSSHWPLIGHDYLGQHLLSALVQQRLARFVLFSGPAHVGKSTAALWLAQVEFCQKTASGQPCGTCPDCRQLIDRQHPSCQILDGQASSSIGVDDIRQALETFHLRSWSAKRMWLIVLKAELLTEAATNTMLKALEELPEGVQVVMTSDVPERLLATLRSRATEYRWHLVPPTDFPAATAGVVSRTALLARAAGRPGLYQHFIRATEGYQQEHQLMKDALTSGGVRLPKGSSAEAYERLLDTEELIARECLLSAVGANRRLWPTDRTLVDAAASQTALQSWVDRAERLLNRHRYLDANVQPQFVYDNLAVA
ncbi:MAG: hypothetical protein HY975_04020 [Candidatus Kerfeldbacteria bacterium]|nr:hypothetical protein [Candidatus Kerfeldbacteria bacterium]